MSTVGFEAVREIFFVLAPVEASFVLLAFVETDDPAGFFFDRFVEALREVVAMGVEPRDARILLCFG